MGKAVEIIEARKIQKGEQLSPIEMAQSFLTNGGDIANLEKMLALQEKFDKMQAKKAYTKAMAEFKKDPPTIIKDKQVGYKHKTGSGSTNYKYATLGSVTKKINSSLAEHGMSVAWPLEQTDKGVKVTCTITHEMGHSESTSLFAEADNTGNKNSKQAMGSTISYLQRYTVLSLTGLATEDQEDDDGISSQPVKCITEEQEIEISEMIESIDEFNEAAFLKWARVDSLGKIPANDFGRVKIALNARAEVGK